MNYKNKTVGKVLSIKVGSFLSTLESSRLKQKEENVKWLFENYGVFKKNYLDQFVAIKDQKIVGTSTDYEQLLSKLTKEYGENFCTIAIEYISTKEPFYPTL